MKIEPGKSYHDGEGRVVRIMGPTKVRADWFWSLCGHWYDGKTGHRIGYLPERGGSYVMGETWRSLVSEAQDDEFWKDHEVVK